MRTAALITLLFAGTPPLHAEPAALPRECHRFAESVQDDFTRRLGRLCARLVTSYESEAGLSVEETDAATRLGRYLSVLMALELRVGHEDGHLRMLPVRKTTAASRYLIADHFGLIEIADRLAPGA